MIKKFLCAVVCVFILLILSSCDESIMVVRFDFGQYPRLIYIVDIDTELDFSGATTTYTQRDGFQSDEYPLVLGDWVEVQHSIDFTMPGEYEVTVIMHLRGGQFPLNFTIQVIDDETYRQMNQSPNAKGTAGRYKTQALAASKSAKRAIKSGNITKHVKI